MTDIFFERRETREFIAEYGTAADWTIYVGLGCTIDRTGMTWAGLVERLLAPFEDDLHSRQLVVEQFGSVRAATMVESLFAKKYPKKSDSLDALRAELASSLYGSQRYMAGQILPSLASFAFTLAMAGKSVLFVTPNYDWYLYRALKLVAKDLGESSSGILKPKVVLDEGNQGWQDEWVDTSGSISCVYLHGFVSRRSKDSRGTPILGELSYAQTTNRTVPIVARAIRNRNLMIIGSSLTDAPLVSALLEEGKNARQAKSGETSAARVVIQPLQSSELRGKSPEDRRKIIRWNTRRLEALNVKAIYPDFYFQVGQLISELQRCVRFGDADQMLLERYSRRYHERLDTWWDRWSGQMLQEPIWQARAHAALAKLLSEIRPVINAPTSEELKLELWVRWQPQRDSRQLALWASSVGTWPDSHTLRKDRISLDSAYKSVEIFCGGAPKFLVSGNESSDRWRTYLGIPILIENEAGALPLGLISIASMRDSRPEDDGDELSSVSESNLKFLHWAMDPMRELAQEILGPDLDALMRRADGD